MGDCGAGSGAGGRARTSLLSGVSGTRIEVGGRQALWLGFWDSLAALRRPVERGGGFALDEPSHGTSRCASIHSPIWSTVPEVTTDSERLSSEGTDRARQRALLAARTAEANRGRDIVILDLRHLTTFFDYFVIATGTSRRQLHAMSDEIDRALEEVGDRRLGIEGYDESRWILLDYGDVVIHLFDAETRAYYALEDLWGQAERVPFAPRPAGANGGEPSATVGTE